MSDHEQLNELFALSNKGEAEWWPDQVAWNHNYWRFLGHAATSRQALAIVRAEAERWLVERGWEIHIDLEGRFYHQYDCSKGEPICTCGTDRLAAALKFDAENMK